jgi:hypothetical protein
MKGGGKSGLEGGDLTGFKQDGRVNLVCLERTAVITVALGVALIQYAF